MALLTFRAGAAGLLLSQVLAVFSTYPLQVFLLRPGLSLTPIATASALVFLALVHLARPSTRMKIDAQSMVAILILTALPILYGIALLYDYGRGMGFAPTAFYSFRNFVTYSAWLAILIWHQDRVNIELPNPWLERALILVTLANGAAVILQSVFWRIPSMDLITESKAFIGPFMRAGMVYTDSNFLAMNLGMIMMVNRNWIIRYRKILPLLDIVLLLGILLTFSRGALLGLAVIASLALLFGSGLRRTLIILGVAGFLVFLVWAALQAWDLDFLFSRFSNDEGMDSAFSRFRQYGKLFRFFEAHPENVFLGNGPGRAVMLFDEEIHNLFLSMFSDSGLFAPLIMAVQFLLFFSQARERQSRLMCLFCLLQSMTLPNFNGAIYLAFGLTRLRRKPVVE